MQSLEQQSTTWRHVIAVTNQTKSLIFNSLFKCANNKCAKSLMKEEEVYSHRSGTSSYRKYYCMDCARRLNLIE